MSGRFRRMNPPETWRPGQDYWVLVPSVPDHLPVPRSLIFGDPTRNPQSQWFFEERIFQGPNPSLASVEALPSFMPYQAPDDYEIYPRRIRYNVPETRYEPRYVQPRIEEESRLSQEEQKKALNKLRKQLYNPHLRTIIRRLGTNSGSLVQDEDGKRCAICLEDFDTKQILTVTPCNHMFHDECIVPWVKSQGKCPVCRFVISERNASPPRNDASRSAIRRDLVPIIRAFN